MVRSIVPVAGRLFLQSRNRAVRACPVAHTSAHAQGPSKEITQPVERVGLVHAGVLGLAGHEAAVPLLVVLGRSLPK